MGVATRIGPRKPRRIHLREWREHRGLTQQQLADLLYVAGLTVSRWERGTALPSTSVMSAIADALGIEPQDLFHHPDRFRRTYIRKWRQHRQLTLEQLADRVGVTAAAISLLERGLIGYTQKTLEAIAEALQTDPASLLMRDPTDAEAIWSMDPEAIWSIWD
jgi:transcriptional regulator with XRE-family HTH domain